MASVGGFITATDFNNLKNRMKAEITRRKYTGNISGSANANPYAVTPATGGLIRAEHYNQLVKDIKLIRAIASSPSISVDTVTAGSTVIKASHVNQTGARVTYYEGRDLTNRSYNDCSSSCTGGCTTGCATGCTGCGATCSDGCSGCGGACSSGCTGCTDACTGCTGCGSSCSTACLDGCSNTCEAGCAVDCTGGCKGGCTGCGYGCSGTCTGGCGNNCQGTCVSSSGPI
jgi:hypothetical protein